MTTASCILGFLAVGGLGVVCLLVFSSATDSHVLIKCLLAVPVVLLLTPVLSSSLVKTRKMSVNYSCQRNLKQIQGAKATWALEHKQPDTAVPKDSDMFGDDRNKHYIWSKPVCSFGGEYTIGSVGVEATCSLPEERHYAERPLIKNPQAAAMSFASLAAGVLAVSVGRQFFSQKRSAKRAFAGSPDHSGDGRP